MSRKNDIKKAFEAFAKKEIEAIEALPEIEHKPSAEYLEAIASIKEKSKSKSPVKRPFIGEKRITAALVAASLLVISLSSALLGIELAKPEPEIIVPYEPIIDTGRVDIPPTETDPPEETPGDGETDPPEENPGVGEIDPDDPGIRFGLDWYYPTTGQSSSSGFSAAYGSEKSIFNINEDVSLDFYYGINFLYVEDALKIYNIPVFDLCFGKMENDRYVTYYKKDVEENLISEKYKVVLEYDKETNGYRKAYNHSESIVIPKELFTEESGCIYFWFSGINQISGGMQLYKILTLPIPIFYKVEDGKIILSTTEFK